MNLMQRCAMKQRMSVDKDKLAEQLSPLEMSKS